MSTKNSLALCRRAAQRAAEAGCKTEAHLHGKANPAIVGTYVASVQNAPLSLVLDSHAELLAVAQAFDEAMAECLDWPDTPASQLHLQEVVKRARDVITKATT